MINCKLMWCPKDAKKLADFLTKDLTPLLEKHWAAETERTGITHGLDVPAFMAAWEQRGIALIMAYSDGVAVGFMPLYIFRPLFMPTTVITIERWYSEAPEADEAMFDYVLSVAPVLGIDHIHAAHHEGQRIPERVRLLEKDSYTMCRLEV